MNKPKLNQPDVEQSTTIPVVEQQAIVEFKQNNTELFPYKYGEIKIEPNVITYNGKTYIATDSLDPTLEEVRKEWEDDDYTWEEDERFITIYKEHPLDENIVKEILINKCTKNYECYDAADYDNISLPLTLQEHIRLTKTFKAKGWEV